MEILVITGMSGAGKSQAGNILEDVGYYCIDNMPPALIPIFAEMAKLLENFQKVAIVTDLRAGTLFSSYFESIEELKNMNIPLKVLFLDANDEVIARRYRETRRTHPLATVSDSPIIDAIKQEREALLRVKEDADIHIDTSFLLAPQLRSMLQAMFLDDSKDSLKVTCISFGFKYGIPPESNILMDLRFLPNPFYIDDLKEQTGLDEEVVSYVFSSEDARSFVERFDRLMEFLLPLYKEEGKGQVVISVGCTGGKHRSVAIIERISHHIRELGYPVSVVHRDIGKIV